jgi:hypothetical protein
MKLKLLFYISCLFFTFSIASAQNIPTKKIETKFFRPSMTNLFVKSNSNEGNVVVAAGIKLIPELRFDEHGVTKNSLTFNFGSAPVFTQPTDITLYKKAKDEYDLAMKNYRIAVDNEIKNQLSPISKLIVSKWFSVKPNGDMSSELINQRGNYTATDSDVKKDQASENSRLNQLGYDLIKRSYVSLYEITSVKNMEQVYNEADEAAKTAAQILKKEYTPVKRTMEGYVVSYSTNIYKLDWNSEVSANFYKNLYVNEKTDAGKRQDKINAFNQSTYPMNFVYSVSGEKRSVQSNDPASYVLTKRKTMQELLENTAPDIQEDAMYQASKKIDDFRVKAPIFKNYPTLAKIGTKEGLYLDQRMFVYELDGDKKVKKGIATVAKIEDNAKVSTGDTKPSRFRQVAGKKIEPFHFLESKEDRGLSFTLGYTPGSVSAANGFHASIDARVNRFLKVKDANASTLTRGVNLSLNIAYNMVNEQVFISDVKNSEGSSLMAGLSLGKEIAITKKGNIYIFPQIGASYMSYTFTKWNGEDVPEANSDMKDWTAISANVTFGIGINIASNLSLIIKPTYQMLVTTFADKASQEVVDPTSTYDLNDKWKKINDASLPITFGLRLKL